MVDTGICTASGCSGFVNGKYVEIAVKYKRGSGPEIAAAPEGTRPVALISVVAEARGVKKEITVAGGQARGSLNEALGIVVPFCASLAGSDKNICGAISKQLIKLAADPKQPDNSECADSTRCSVGTGGVHYTMKTLGSGGPEVVRIAQEQGSRVTEYNVGILSKSVGKTEYENTGLKGRQPIKRQPAATGWLTAEGKEVLELVDRICAAADNPDVIVRLDNMRRLILR